VQEEVIHKDSVLAYLHPSFMDELRFGIFKDSMNIHGSYRMNLRQPSRQPEHSREYQTGDPIRLIDWKAYAKHNELIIREVQDEASAQVAIAIDADVSMQWPDASLPANYQVIQKLECAVRVGMALAYAHLKVGDMVKVIYTQGRIPKKIFRPRSSTDVVAAFDRVSSKSFQPETIYEDCIDLKNWPERLDKLYFVSDLLFLTNPENDSLNLGQSRILQIYHLLSSLEVDTEWIDSDSFYHDQGGSLIKEYQGKTLNQNKGYDWCLGEWKQKLRQEFRKVGASYVEINEKTSVQSFLHSIVS